MARVSGRTHALSSLLGALAVAGALSASALLGACSFEAPKLQLPPAPPPPPNADPQVGCSPDCHGDAYSIAPPGDTTGGTSTSLRGVGAHREHLDPAPTFHRAVQCEDCHRVPEAPGDPGHLDDTAGAELTFSALASADGARPEWSGTTCTVYCHGATLAGGALTTPTWTVVDSSQDRCGNCHGTPPPAPHPEGGDCGTCHPTVAPGSTTFLDPGSHINGKVEFTTDLPECDDCHGGGGVAAPPVDLDGNTDRGMPGVGAHREHFGPSNWHREIFCAQCHVVPVSESSPGHQDGDNVAEVLFDELNPDAEYDFGSATCTNLYCHGNASFQLGRRVWTDDLMLDCDSCHDDGSGGGGGGNSGPGGGGGDDGDDGDDDDELSRQHKKHYEESIECFECHGQVVDQMLQFVEPNLHINGVFDVSIPSGGAFDSAQRRCSNLICHENEDW
jgi:predicted CxxxxCH...CXXCH cytochrome family protein